MEKLRCCIALDFDGVLINRQAFKDYLMEICNKQGISNTKFLASYETNKKINGFYKFDNHLREVVNKDPLALRKLNYEISKACFGKSFPREEMVYSDVSIFFKKIREYTELNIDVVLISRGDKALQELKLLSTKLDYHLRQRFFVTTESKGTVLLELLNQYQEIYFVDDNVDELSDSFNHILRNWDKGGGGKYKIKLAWLNRLQNTNGKVLQIGPVTRSGLIGAAINTINTLDQIINMSLSNDLDWVRT